MIIIAYIDSNGAKRFATVEDNPAAIAEMRQRLAAAGFKLLDGGKA